jgi:hypothetical protein
MAPAAESGLAAAWVELAASATPGGAWSGPAAATPDSPTGGISIGIGVPTSGAAA